MPIGQAYCYANCGEYNPERGGVVDVATNYAGPIWHVVWDTQAQGAAGDYIWFDPSEDGTPVTLRATAVDVHGNAETVVDDHLYTLVVDNVAPSATVTLHDPATGDEVTEVERNSSDGVLILATSNHQGPMQPSRTWSTTI